jgi:hypothetical protein
VFSRYGLLVENNNQAMTAALSKAILPICKPISRIKIQDGKQPRIHSFMQDINIKYSEKERICAIDQGFTCLASQTAQNLPLADLESCPTLMHLINDNQKYKPQYINKTVRQTFPNC